MRLIILVAICLLTACSNLSKGAFDTLSHAFRRSPTIQYDAEKVNKLPYFQIAVETQKVSSVFLLTRISDDTQYWQNTAQESLIINNGVIVRTTGLPKNIHQSRFVGNNPFVKGLQHIKEGDTAVREIDYSNFMYGTRSESTFYILGQESIIILDKSYLVTHIKESIRNDFTGLHTDNHYWVDNKGFIWKSQQTLFPDFTLTIIQLKPYGVNP